PFDVHRAGENRDQDETMRAYHRKQQENRRQIEESVDGSDHADIEEAVMANQFVDADRRRSEKVLGGHESGRKMTCWIEVPAPDQDRELVLGGSGQTQRSGDLTEVAIVRQSYGRG